ncbi:MAG: hypothetical protein JST00_30720 [Deltaproteobacteria bacterium]|nr:hypothetical protein [Deltaproteobacteria bacterium]
MVLNRVRAAVRGLAGALFLSLLLVAIGGPARADLKVDGRWRQSALREDWTVQQWLAGCGPAPTNSASGGGEIVAIRLEGDELAFVGGGRVFRSNQCYDPMPTLARESHSRDASGKTWRTRCTTPPNDPRKAILNTLVVATSDTHIDMIETGRYEIVLETGRCLADIRRTRSFDLVPEEKPVASATPPPEPKPKEPPPEPKPKVCDAPGDPIRLEVRPSKKLMRTGDTFQFRPLVLDEKGCATKTPTTWKLAAGAPAGVTVDTNGKVTIGASVPEGTFEIIATAASKDTRVTVEVTSPAHYDDLLASSGLNAQGENDAASVVTIASTSLGAGEGRVEDRAKSRRYLFIGIIGGVLVLLVVVAALLARRSKRAKELEREAESRHGERLREALERKRVREEQHAAQLRAHEESLRAREMQKQKAIAAAQAAQAAAAAAAAQAALPRKRGKICPTCGERSDGSADFCGKDGTALVLLN